MKKLLLLCPVLGLLWSACSNEFDIAAPFKEIPVVYGIISPDDSAHYIRIERAFIDPDASAYVVAKIADSLYYPANAISVFLQRVGNAQRYQLTRVDGNLDGYIRDTGTFARTPNWLYKIKDNQLSGGLTGGATYRLIIERADGKPAITGETTVPDTMMLIRPEPSVFTPRRINIAGSVPIVVEWRCRANAVIFDVYLNIRYREIASNGSQETKSFRWKAAKNVLRENTVIGGGFYRGRSTFLATDFYNALLQNIEPSTTLQRYFNGIDVIVEGAGPEIAAYQESEAVNSGLTGAEVSTSYTNLSEGFGIFTARKSWPFPNFELESKSVDSLNLDPKFRVLNFKG